MVSEGTGKADAEALVDTVDHERAAFIKEYFHAEWPNRSIYHAMFNTDAGENMEQVMTYQPIENYGVIGNMRSIALLGTNGSIDFLCYPNFDSPTIFAYLLDDGRGGRFQIQPNFSDRAVRQHYLPDTNILLTRFLAEEAAAELTDYMPISATTEQPNEIIRTVTVVRGKADFRLWCQPRFNYAR